jgi:hypothetical protein
LIDNKPNHVVTKAWFGKNNKLFDMKENEEIPEWMQEILDDMKSRAELAQMVQEVKEECKLKKIEELKSFKFYMLPEELAASKELAHPEKLIAAYLYTICIHRKKFTALDTLVARKTNTRRTYIPIVLKRLEQFGLIIIENPNGPKRVIKLKKTDFSGRFYKLYCIVAESTVIIPKEKILISYILSFHDNGKPFYAKNGIVKELLNITKEEFNTCRKHFEQMGWVQVIYPKSPKRQLVVLQHPCEFLAQSASTK